MALESLGYVLSIYTISCDQNKFSTMHVYKKKSQVISIKQSSLQKTGCSIKFATEEIAGYQAPQVFYT